MERILVYGVMGTGKSTGVLQLAKWLRPTGAQFYVLDTDDSYPKSLTEFPGLDNVHVTFGFDWEDYMKWQNDTLPLVKAGVDWIVVDRIDKGWSRVQNYMTETVYNQSLSERLMQVRKEQAERGKKGMVVSIGPQADWIVVNSLFKSWFLSIMYKSRANVYLAASADNVRDGDDEEVRDTYGPIGVKPAGQRDIPYEVDTILYLSARKNQEGTMDRKISTMKDRGNRRYLNNEKFVSLPVQYLQAVAKYSRNGNSA